MIKGHGFLGGIKGKQFRMSVTCVSCADGLHLIARPARWYISTVIESRVCGISLKTYILRVTNNTHAHPKKASTRADRRGQVCSAAHSNDLVGHLFVCFFRISFIYFA